MAAAALPKPSADDAISMYGKNSVTEIIKQLKLITGKNAAETLEKRQGTLHAMLDEVDGQLWLAVDKLAKQYAAVDPRADKLVLLERALHAKMSDTMAKKLYTLGQKYATMAKTGTPLKGLEGLGIFDTLMLGGGRSRSFGYGALGAWYNPLDWAQSIASGVGSVADSVWDGLGVGAKSVWKGVKWIGTTIYKGLKFIWQTAVKLLKFIGDLACALLNSEYATTVAAATGAVIAGAYSGGLAAKEGAMIGASGAQLGKAICSAAGKGGGVDVMIGPEAKDPWNEFFSSPMSWVLIGGGVLLVVFATGD